MKTMKRILAFVLSSLLAVSLLTTAFAAEDTVIANGTGGEGITWTLTEGGVLTVSGNGPIVDDTLVEEDGNGTITTEKLDCIAFQLTAAFEERTKDLDPEETERARFDFVKTLVIEEGITAIPDEEFDSVYPRSITLPSTLESIGWGSVNAMFATTLTVNNKDLVTTGNISIAGYNENAQPYADIEAAIDAMVASRVGMENLSSELTVFYDMQCAYAIREGVEQELTAQQMLSDFNAFYGTDFTDPDAVISFCLPRVNDLFGTSFNSAEDALTVVQDDDGQYVQPIGQIEEKISEMYGAFDIEERLYTLRLGEDGYVEYTPYTWLTVYAPKKSNTEEAAKISGVSFQAVPEPGADNSFIGRIRQLFGKIKAFFMRIWSYIQLYWALLRPNR
ncbi:MAG: hypothetical protein IJT41_07590 [Clostridia bacterium]|nr:hypothetical protein [Clostridia bacterium]